MEVIDQIYKLRRNFVIIGLTGRTGSGCSMLADWMRLDKDEFCKQKLDPLATPKDPYANDARKIRIVSSFIREKWTKFTIIKASDIIVYYALLLENFAEFRTAISRASTIKNLLPEEESKILGKLDELRAEYDQLHERAKEIETIVESYETKSKHELEQSVIFLSDIKPFRKKVIELLGNKYIPIFQQWGNNIRLFNSVLQKAETAIHAPSCLARKIKQFLKAIHRINKEENKPTYIVIDSLRNPYEVLYFRERYASFYLMSMNTSNEARYKNLFAKGGYTDDQIQQIDKQESNKGDIGHVFAEQDIDKCLELADIHLSWKNSIKHEKDVLELPFDNNDIVLSEGEAELVKQLITYVALIMHPGLVPPSPHERCMQIAYTAKLNSGCLSRQVGAVVTNTDFSVKSVGWNTVPKGQVPCSLRCMETLCSGEEDIAFSDFERSGQFSSTAKRLMKAYEGKNYQRSLGGLQLTYCFKDIHTSSNDKQTHNQVHTRSLHAEENSFLQLAKYGTTGIDGGYLYTTASCCELCAKKAFQLGIKKIYYIDAYPGITNEHILSNGLMENRPKMELFHGAVGRAYVSLFNPYVPLKDEIEERTSVNVKKVVSREKNSKKNVSKKKSNKKV